MSAEVDFVLWALAQASDPGVALPPRTLLAAAAADPDPIAALADAERSEALFTAFLQEFEFLPFVKSQQKFPAEEMQQRVVGVLRWAIQRCHARRAEDDPRREQLISILIVAQYCGHAVDIWNHLSQEAANDWLRAELASLLPRMRVNISMGFTRSPISDAEAIGDFNRADEAGDWPAVADHLRHFNDFGSPKTLPTQAALYLHRFFPETFVEIVASAKQTYVAKQFLDPLRGADACKAALRSGNPYAEFAVTYRFAAWDRFRRQPVEDQWPHDLLSDVLVKVAGDQHRWALWMRAFCSYAQDFPFIAIALGRALTRVSEEAVASYVNAITLTPARSASREIVGETLASFREKATLERRKYLWTCAYERWADWNFGSRKAGDALIGTASSELDYAIVGYAVECLSKDDCQRELMEIRSALGALPDRWFRSVSDFGREKNRLLSRSQPFAHATTTPTDWLATVEYLPYDLSDRYGVLLLGVMP